MCDACSHSAPRRFTNPFNAKNFPIQLENGSITTADMRQELERRGLPDTGTRPNLENRLLKDNEHNLSPIGQRKIYHRKLALVKEAALAHIVPFARFAALPSEIRVTIWKLSLPGPRVLAVSSLNRNEDKLHFREDDNCNPAALFVCRESRAVALQRYRLEFGSSNLYADLAGGDILYFGQRWEQVFSTGGAMESFWRWDDLAESTDDDEIYMHTISQTLWENLGRVKRIAIGCHLWYSLPRDPVSFLQWDLAVFTGLEELLIVDGGSDDFDPVDKFSRFSLTPGYVVIELKPESNLVVTPSCDCYEEEEDSEEDCEDVIYSEEDNGEPCYVEPFISAEDLRRQFFQEPLDGEQNLLGYPDVRIVIANRITNVPGDDWERDEGEPFVSFRSATS